MGLAVGRGGRRGTVIGQPDFSRKIISSSRAQNVAIVLSRLSLPADEIAMRIDAIDPKGLERETVERVTEVRRNQIDFWNIYFLFWCV